MSLPVLPETTTSTIRTYWIALHDWLAPIMVFWQEQPYLIIALKLLLQAGLLIAGVYWLYRTLSQQAAHASRLLRGVMITFTTVLILWTLTRVLELPILEAVLATSIQLLFVALIVIFQPELRRLLISLGQADWRLPTLGHKSAVAAESAALFIQHLVEAVRYLSKSKTGALIVLEPENGQPMSESYLEAGTRLDAHITTELLLTIFHANAPLHDGALVIDSNFRAAAAGVLLPLTEDPNLSWRFGTRHRAALGLTETSDSHCIVVSEETGTISLVSRGQITRLSGHDELLIKLESLYGVSPEEITQWTTSHQAPGAGVGRRLSQLLDVELWPVSLQRMMSSMGTIPSNESSTAKTKRAQ
ncbi:MAG: diadenylate cyclase CdaA [Vampirovibrionales bacterium]|nr:diadenylate cyclase CdaA [Vampirovibrionales bacterium]